MGHANDAEIHGWYGLQDIELFNLALLNGDPQCQNSQIGVFPPHGHHGGNFGIDSISGMAFPG